MKLHLLTVGTPRLPYARAGLAEYSDRLSRNPKHEWRITHIADKKAGDASHILTAAGSAYKVAMAIEGQEFTSEGLAAWLGKRALDSREVCFMIGGPHGLPDGITAAAD